MVAEKISHRHREWRAHFTWLQMEPRAQRLEPADEMGMLRPQVTDLRRNRPPGFRAPQTSGSHAAQGVAHGSRDVPARGSLQPPPGWQSAPLGRLEALPRGGDSPSSPRQLRLAGTVLGPCWRMRHCRSRRLSSPPEAGRQRRRVPHLIFCV